MVYTYWYNLNSARVHLPVLLQFSRYWFFLCTCTCMCVHACVCVCVYVCVCDHCLSMDNILSFLCCVASISMFAFYLEGERHRVLCNSSFLTNVVEVIYCVLIKEAEFHFRSDYSFAFQTATGQSLFPREPTDWLTDNWLNVSFTKVEPSENHKPNLVHIGQADSEFTSDLILFSTHLRAIRNMRFVTWQIKLMFPSSFQISLKSIR